MALSRLALQTTQLLPKARIFNDKIPRSIIFQKQKFTNSNFSRRLICSKATDDKSNSSLDVAVSSKKSESPMRRSSSFDLLSSELGLGNALKQATESMNRVLEKLSPWNLTGSVREKDDYYKLRYEFPGVAKEDLKIKVEDGVLSITGEQKQEEEDENDGEYWSSSSYGYYNTSLVLPEDAKVDDIKAEMKDGVLYLTIPKDQSVKKDVKHIQVL